MKKDIAEKWVAALRSGKYKQVRENMRRYRHGEGYSYCCLGVLTDIVCTKEERADEAMFMDEYGDGYLNPTISDRCSVNTSASGIAKKILVKMNDEDGKSFEEIADCIEANWERI